MCAVGAYNKHIVPIPDYESSVNGGPMPSTSSKEALISLVQTIKFIDNWIK